MTALEQEIAECPDCKSMRGLGGQQCTGHQLLWQRVRIAELESALTTERNRSEHEPCPVCGHALLYLDDHYECDECGAKFDGVTTAITIHKDIKSQLATVTAERDELARLKDPHTLHVNLLRGFPAQLSRMDYLHLAGATDYDAVCAERDRLAAENGMFKMGFHEAKQQEEKP